MNNFIFFQGTKKQAREAYPAAMKIVAVCGGWAIFDTLDAYEQYKTWKNQK